MEKVILLLLLAVAIIILYSGFTSTKSAAGKVYKDTTVTNFFRRTTGWIAGDAG